MDIFRIAVASALYDIDDAHQHYSNVANRAMSTASLRSPWTPPNDDAFREIEFLGNQLLNAVTTLQAYIFDFLREMQTLLVGPMFDQRITPRIPRDPSFVVVRLDRYDQLIAYFNQQTAWGRNQAQIEKRPS
jgi:hypothetical protein